MNDTRSSNDSQLQPKEIFLNFGNLWLYKPQTIQPYSVSFECSSKKVLGVQLLLFFNQVTFHTDCKFKLNERQRCTVLLCRHSKCGLNLQRDIHNGSIYHAQGKISTVGRFVRESLCRLSLFTFVPTTKQHMLGELKDCKLSNDMNVSVLSVCAGPVIDWQPVWGVYCLSPSACWESLTALNSMNG